MKNINPKSSYYHLHLDTSIGRQLNELEEISYRYYEKFGVQECIAKLFEMSMKKGVVTNVYYKMVYNL